MRHYDLLDEADIPVLADAALTVLDKVGVLCENDDIIDALETAGATVDRGRQTVRFPRSLTEEFVARVKEEKAAQQKAPPSRRFGSVGMPGLGVQVAQFVYDYRNGERRPGNTRDFIELVKFGAMLEDGRVGHCLLLTDVPPLLEPLEAAMVLAEYASAPGNAFAWNVKQVDYLIEMGQILGREDWFTWGACCFAHPLRFDKDVADKLIRRTRARNSSDLAAMPVAGMTTPVTTAGYVVVTAAEYVATWIAGRAVCPKVPLSGGMYGAALDMRTGSVSYSAFDAMRNGFATAEFMQRWTGVTVNVGGGEYCDAKVPGYFAALEKAYKALMIKTFTGVTRMIGQGMLEEGKTLCAVQLMLERELTLGADLLGRPVDVNPRTVALDTILDVGTALEKGYFDQDHTLENFREDAWLPPLMDRSGYAGPEQEKAVLDKLQDKVDDMVASYRKPDVDPARLAEMRKVVERARAALLE